MTGAPFRSAPAIWSASADLGSKDLLVGPLTALTATRIQYGCTVVHICAERMRPLDPLRVPSTVRSYCEPQDRRSMNASAHACRESAGERWMAIDGCGFCCCCGSSSGGAGFRENCSPVRTREYDFKSFIKRIVSGSTLGRLHNTIGIYIHGSGHKLSMWYHVVLGHSAVKILLTWI